MARFRNTTKQALSLLKPDGHAEAHLVEPGEEVEVPGEIDTEATTDDAYIVGKGDKARAFSRQLWESVETPRQQRTQLPAPEKGSETVKEKEGDRP